MTKPHFKAPRHLKCECNGIYDIILPTKQINKLTRKPNHVRECSTCHNIRDIGLMLHEDLLFVNYQIKGIDPLGKFNSSKGVWIQRV